MARPKKTEDGSAQGWLAKWGDMITPISGIEHDIEVIPSGSLTLDLALAHGGWPRGCIARLYGKKGTCKTTILQRTAAKALELGLGVLWIDAETSFIPFIARANGLPAEDPRFRIWRNNPTAKTKLTYENMARIVEAWITDEEWNPKGALIVVDSLSAIVTEKQLAGDIEDKQIASVASANARWFPRLLPLLESKRSTMICIQQMRANFNNVSWGGEATDPGGGWALHHYAAVEIKLGFGKKVNANDPARPIAFDIKANRFAYAGIRDKFYFRSDYGIDTPRELMELALTYDIVKQKGAFYTFASGEVVQGMENARQFLLDKPERMDALELQIRDKARSEPAEESTIEDDDLELAEEI